jgi:hypothetical protein
MEKEMCSSLIELPGDQNHWAAAFRTPPLKGGWNRHGSGLAGRFWLPPAKLKGEEAPRRAWRRCVQVSQPLLALGSK